MKTMLPARGAAASASKAETLAMDRKKFPAAAICDRITRHSAPCDTAAWTEFQYPESLKCGMSACPFTSWRGLAPPSRERWPGQAPPMAVERPRLTRWR